MDHSLNSWYEMTLNEPQLLLSASSAHAAIESASAVSADISGYDTAISGLPVWFNALNSAPFGNIPFNAALPIEHHITYAPAIATAGLSSVVMASTWLLCGYFTGAFHYKNTLEHYMIKLYITL